MGDERGVVGRDLVERIGAPQRLATVEVDRNTPRGSRQPRGELATRVEAPRRSPRLHERLLRRLLAQARIG